ncbi:unnamed protein product [Trypanosoma congolense IL3000]|uniref:WGS project CAEQ00000000 data, annotated contig 641 n=1 Tax=Trypanosoma congolense (strain IL3000) TaxID=1068625 RepID=F9WHF6_TRYCI|nr:unnamed protein product [Trypanosoma congolense IL3000]
MEQLAEDQHREEGTTVLRLHGLPYSIEEDKIRDFFSDFNLADEDAIVFFVEGLHRGTGFIRLRNAGDAPLVIRQLNRRHIDESRYIEISYSSEEELQRAIGQQEQSSKALVLRLRGLPFLSTADDVKAFIESMDGVLRIDMCRDMDGRCAGDAFIELASEEGVARIKTLHKKMMGARYIEVLPSTLYDREAILRASSFRGRRGRHVTRGGAICVTEGDTSQPSHGSMVFQRFIDPIFSSNCGGYIQPVNFDGHKPMQYQYQHGYSSTSHHHSQHLQHHSMHPQPTNLQPYGSNNLALWGRGVGMRGGRFPSAPQQYRQFHDASRAIGGSGIAGEGPAGHSSAPYPTGYSGQPFLSVFHGQSPLVVARPPSAYVVRIRGAPFSATEEAIAEFFSGVRIPTQGVHMVYNEQNRLTGEAFVEVESKDDVLLALRKNGGMMGTRYIEVFESSPAAMQRLGTPPIGMMPYPVVPHMLY